MTDNEIIKALECCSTATCISKKCPYEEIHDIPTCTTKLAKDALDLINRQKAEISVLRKLLDKAETEMNNQSENIKKLTKDCYSMQSTLAKMSMGVEEAKAEAIKEFAERLKIDLLHKLSVQAYRDARDVVDNLVKEMVGEG